MSSELLDLSLEQLLPQLREEEVALESYFEAALDRIEALDGKIQALLPEEGRRERLLATADELRARFPKGERPPLFGALVGVKDLFKVDGFPRRAGSQLPAEAFEGEESVIVRQLKELGAVVLGITVSTEFAYFSPGPTRNPRNPNHTPGGSSSGSAAAVAAGYCRLALGTQTIGSISRPAAFCGITGLKPTFGSLSAEGAFPFSWSADHVGFLAGSVSDARLAYGAVVSDARPSEQAIFDQESSKGGDPPARNGGSRFGGSVAGGAAPETPATSLEGVRFAIPDDAYLSIAEESTVDQFNRVLARLEEAGAKIVRTRGLSDIEAIRKAHREMIAREFAEVHAPLVERYRSLYSESSLELIEEGRAVPEERAEAARAGRLEVRKRLEVTLREENCDAWLSPATVGAAPEGIGATGNPVMNLPWTYAGLPTVATPSGTGSNGLPLGLQIAFPSQQEEALLALSERLESLLPL